MVKRGRMAGVGSAWRRAAGALVLLALAFTPVPPARAAAGAPGLAQWGVDQWSREDGLAAAWVRDIVEGPDGFIWVATANGLSRFDGRRFRQFDASRTAGLPSSGIGALAMDRDGALWIGLEFGGLRVLRDGKVATAPQADGFPDDVPVRDLLLDASGTLWVATEGGLWRIGPEGAARVVPPVEADAGVRVVALVRQGDAVLARTRDHGLWRVEDGVAQAHPDVPGCAGSGLASGGGQLYMACAEGIWHWAPVPGQWQPVSPERGVVSIFADASGALWFGSRDGLARWSEGQLEIRPLDRTMFDWRVRAFHEDARGGVWIGSSSGGLARLQAGAVRAFGDSDGLGVSTSTALLVQGDGDLLVGSALQGLVRWRPGQGQLAGWTQADGLPGETPWALAQDPRRPGGAWVGGDAGLAWLEHDRLGPVGPEGLSYDGPVRIVYVDPKPPHALWISAMTGGALELLPGQRRVHDASNGLGLGRVRFFHRDRDGRLLAGGLEGLFVFDGERWSRREVGGRPLRALTAMAESDNGDLWLASGVHGLVWSSGADATTFGYAEGLPFLPVYSLQLDGRDGLWLSGDGGLARVSLAEHARWRQGGRANLPIERLGLRDGLRDEECNGWGHPAVARLADGRLVYPTITGVALLDPFWTKDDALAPSDIYVDQAWSGGRALASEGLVSLDPGERSLRVGFSAVQMLRPEALSFRYRLEGFDDDWIPAGQATESNYARLTPGDYRFRLQARLPDRDWVESSHVLEVHAAPHFWETAWFRAIVLAAVLLALFSIYAWRRQLHRRHAATLDQARRFLREVIDTSPNPIFARRRDGTYSLANHAAADIYGLEPGELEGRSPAAIGVELAGMAGVEAMDQEVVASGRERSVAEVQVVDHAGRPRWFRVVKHPLFGPDGKQVEQVIGTAVDITGHKLATLELMRKEATLIDSRSEARQLSRRLLRAQEDERRRLARELHDDLTQRLAGLAMLAWGALQSRERDPGREVTASLREVALELERVANDVQMLSRDLHPPALESVELAEALRAECETFAKRAQMRVDFRCDELPAGLSSEVALAIYRIVQEGLRNVRTHSGVREARVWLQAGPQALRLEISDEGSGFNPADPRLRQGLGLSSLRERARLAGGELQVDSRQGQGTRLVFTLDAKAWGGAG